VEKEKIVIRERKDRHHLVGKRKELCFSCEERGKGGTASSALVKQNTSFQRE